MKRASKELNTTELASSAQLNTDEQNAIPKAFVTIRPLRINFLRMKNIIYLVSIGLIISLSSCLSSDDQDLQKQNEIAVLKDYLAKRGIVYTSMDSVYIIKYDETKRDSTSVQAGSIGYVLVNYNIRLLTDNTLIETNNAILAAANNIKPIVAINGPVMLSMELPPLSGIYKGLIKMKEKDSATFAIPSNLGLGSYSTASIPSYSTLLFEVKLVKYISNPIDYDKSFWSRWVTDSMNLTLADSNSYGIYEKILYPGSSAVTTLIQDLAKVKVAYKGFMADGRSFTQDFDTISFTVGSGSLITGFEKAMYALKQNSRARIFVPYTYAYGVNGKKSTNQILMPPYTSLYYEVVVVDVQ
jgi:FKBP-type peptidyl-prolyl cis-trans isomerase